MAAHYTCDRCGSIITADRSVIRAESGSLIYVLSDVDLCPDCATSLGHWMRQAAVERRQAEAAAVAGSAAR